MIDGTPLTKAMIKKALDVSMGKVERQKTDSLIEFAKQFIRECIDDPNYKCGSIQVYRSTLKHLKAYNPDLKFEEVDLTFFYRWMKYLNGKGFKQMYVNKLVMALKTFLNDTTERGINPYTAYKWRKFSVPKPKAFNIFLTKGELEQVYRTDFKWEALDRVRDMFLLSAWTGTRYSDLHQIKEENIVQVDNQKCL